jgi:Flp pilus assembly protein TadB
VKKMDEEYKIARHSKEYVKDIVILSEKDVEKIERVCGALERQYDAEASKEAHQKFRILFERVAQEHLPFIIYCIYMSAVGITAFININKVEGWFLVGYLVALVLIMLVPLLLLWKNYKKHEKKPEEPQ